MTTIFYDTINIIKGSDGIIWNVSSAVLNPEKNI